MAQAAQLNEYSAIFGTHSHAPPPMHKTPMAIQNEIIGKADHRGNTPGKFLRSDALAKFLEDVGHNGMAGLHPSLNNTYRIGSWIQKERLLQNPLGQSYEGIVLN
ncbi:hypothetical protein Egran_01677 [Elaphomyces granulatus]|uniref:Uncharacterized protein n=1 Tax=Elaphomyces granulatus TaxID=519963 RepID=A0A232M2G6_9EURO|nr:hypothetical protein Egran_01677 [Elaphomyces granulatus]